MNKHGSKWITPKRRLAIYIRDGFHCLYCGTNLKGAKPADVTLDHLKPRCQRGDNTSGNLITACRSCNSARQDKPWREYATGGAVERILRHRRRVVNVELAAALIAGTAGDPELESAR